ncbi:MAG: heat-inducible transcriptional repressor HrcA [Jatrophihabitans sp.]
MNVEERKLAVLQAIVQDFITTREPVGSRALVDRHHLDVSPATIRNDMAALEDEGLIEQPHTSAGRIPTDAGYRRFVDQLSTLKPLSSAERRAIEMFLIDAVDLDDVLHRAVRALAQLTRNVAVVQYPSLSRSKIRHLEIVSLSAARLMLVVITDTGRVEQRVVELPAPVSDEAIGELRNTLNQQLRDRPLAEAPGIVTELPASVPVHLRGLVTTLTTVLLETLVERHGDRVLLGGTANLTEHAVDFPAIRPVLEALEEQVVLLRLLDQTAASGEVLVRIGYETGHQGLLSTSLVTSGYGPAGTLVGGVGVLGPRRMDYAHTMARVAAVARYVGELLDDG